MNKIRFLVLLTLSISFLTLAGSSISGKLDQGQIKSESDVSLKLRIFPQKEKYLLGEIVKVRFQLENFGESTISLPFRPNVMTGYLKIWISREGEDFSQYNNSTWGLLEGGGVTVHPGKSIESHATILWNRKPQIIRSDGSTIATDYAFQEPGSYRVKAIFSIPSKSAPDMMERFESDPERIELTEPMGNDLKIWNRIKGNADLAFFLQQADIRSAQVGETEETLKEARALLEGYPDSYLAEPLQMSLEKFREVSARRQELKRKTKSLIDRLPSVVSNLLCK